MCPGHQLKASHRAVLLALTTLACPATVYGAAAGRVYFVSGEVVAVAPSGTQRALTMGSEINTGDAIHTLAGGRAQVRFADGGFISLQSNTQFRVDEYRYENKTDGQEKGFFSLIKGGLRAITGAIGRSNRKTYQVATPSATIGIRGTGYNVTQGDGLLVNVGEGAISLTNNAGELVVTAGGAAFVADFNTAPTFTFQKPDNPPPGFLAPQPDTPFSEVEQRDETGGLAILPASLTSGGGYALAIAGSYNPDGRYPFTSVSSNVSATFSSTSQLTQYGSNALGTATVSFSATDGIIGWGRWNGGTTTGSSPHPLDLTNVDTGDTFHYVVGLPTPQADIDAMSNITATYSLIGSTRPTADGSEGGLGTLNSGSLTAYFGSRTVDANLQISFPAVGAGPVNNYSISATSMTINNNSTFSEVGTATGGNACFFGCNANISGFFAGANAARAGVAYSFSDSSNAPGNVSGVAAFTKSSSGPDGIDPNIQ